MNDLKPSSSAVSPWNSARLTKVVLVACAAAAAPLFALLAPHPTPDARTFPIFPVSPEERSPVRRWNPGGDAECSKEVCSDGACVNVWEEDGKTCQNPSNVDPAKGCQGKAVCQRGTCTCLDSECIAKAETKCNRCTEENEGGGGAGGAGGGGGAFGDGGISIPPPGCYFPNYKSWKVRYIDPADGCMWAILHRYFHKGVYYAGLAARMGCPYLPPDFDQVNIEEYGDAPLVSYDLLMDPCSSFNCENYVTCPNFPCASPWPVDPGQVCASP